MKTKEVNISPFQYIESGFILVLIIWISFFPAPIQEKYHLATKIFLLAGFIFLLIKQKASVFKFNDLSLWIFLTAIGLNVFFAQQKTVALKTYLDLSIPMLCIYYLVINSFSNEKSFALLAKTICLSSVIVSLFAILESLFAFNLLYVYFIKNPYYERYISGFSRPMSTHFAAPALGSYLVGCLPFSFFLFKREKSLLKILGSIGIIFNTAVIILTFSRASFLALIAMIIFYLFAMKNYRLMAIFFVIVIVFIFLFSLLPYPFYRLGINGLIKDNLLPNYSLEKANLAPPIIKDRPGLGPEHFNKFRIDWILKDSLLSAYRLDRLDMALRIIKDHPLVGVGFQHFRLRFYEYYPYKYKFPYEIMVADNMYLTLLSETGIIGFSGFLIYVFWLLRKKWIRLRTLKFNYQDKLPLSVSLAAFIGLLINMAGYDLFYWPNQYMLFCIIIAVYLNGFRKKLIL